MTMTAHTLPDPAGEFRTVIEAAGLLPSEVAPDGTLRRCPTVDHPKSLDGAYKLFEDGRGGWFEDHADGVGVQFWTAAGAEPLTPAERETRRKEVEKARVERERHQAEAQAKAVERARRIWASLPPEPAPTPYTDTKGLPPPPGTRTDGTTLVMPIFDSDGQLMNVERIFPNGDKRTLKDGPVKGGYFPVGGKRADLPLLIGEGLYTVYSAHLATGFPGLVARNKDNLMAVAVMARSKYPERGIVIMADFDGQNAGTNPGVESASKAAAAIGAKLAIPPAEAGQKVDFDDILRTQGPEAVKRIIENAEPVEKTAGATKTVPPDNWQDPLPLTPEEKIDPYPLEALPGTIGEAVAEVTGFVQCPVALTACSALAAVSTVAAGLADVRRAAKLSGPIGLFFLALADSGERKTTVDGFFTKAIRQWEAEQEKSNRPVVQVWRAADDAWKAERDGLLTAIREASKRGNDTAELKAKLADLEARKPERPKVPQLLIGDATSEALTWRLAHKWPVGGLLSSEAGVVFGGHAMGRDSIMRNLATLNSLWDAGPLSVERKTSECFTIRAARLSAHLAAQPGTVRQWLENCRGLARDSGFLARFLMAWPESTQGRRMFQEAPEHWPALSRFHQHLADLMDTPLCLDDFGQLSPAVLDLDPKAKAVWIEFHNEVEAELASGGDMAEARDVASKAGDNAARLAALFHVFEHGPAGTIGADHMRRAARIVAWHLFEARRFLNKIVVPEAVADALALEAWMVQKCKANHLAAVPIADIQQRGPSRTRRKAVHKSALMELEQCHRARRVKDGNQVFIQVNPAILDGC